MSGEVAGRRVVVTGFGAVTPVGQGVEETWRNLLAGESGVQRIRQFDPSSFPAQMAGEVNDFRLPHCVDAKDARRMSRFELFALASAEEAIASSGLKLANEDPETVGVVVGCGVGSLTTSQRESQVLFERGGMRVNPFFLPMMLPNMATAQVTRVFDIRGYSSTVATACASGAQSIGEAGEAIRRGAAEVMLAGGAEASICELGLSGFAVLRALSQRNDDPKRASRPFDRDRDGLVPAEAAAILVLESLEHARARGAQVIAELVGYGASSDAHHVVAPHPEGRGAALAIRLALRQAGLAPSDIDYINAHATATPVGDSAEAKAIASVFGERGGRVAVSATKSMIGHAMGAAGAIGSLAAVLSIRDGVIHPTINYETPDPTCDLDCVPNDARRADVRVALAEAFAFGGHNTVVAFKRFE